MGFGYNLFLLPTVSKFWKSVRFRQNYHHQLGDPLFLGHSMKLQSYAYKCLYWPFIYKPIAVPNYILQIHRSHVHDANGISKHRLSPYSLLTTVSDSPFAGIALIYFTYLLTYYNYAWSAFASSSVEMLIANDATGIDSEFHLLTALHVSRHKCPNVKTAFKQLPGVSSFASMIKLRKINLGWHCNFH